MQYKHALLTTILATSLTLPAAAHEITFAVGGLSSTLNALQSYIDTTPNAESNIQGSSVATSLGGEASIAYIWNVNSGLELGFEGFYDFVSGLEVQGTLGQRTSFNNAWGARGVPAFKITNNTKIFLTMGYVIVDQTLDISDVDPALIPLFTTTSIESQNQGGFQYGAGVETLIYNTLGIRIAYTAEQSAELTLESDDTLASFNSTPTVYNFFFGMTYHLPF